MQLVFSAISKISKIHFFIFSSLFLLYFTTSSGGFESGDAITRYETAKSFLAGGLGELPENKPLNSTARGRNGVIFSSYGLTQSFLMLPVIALARTLPLSEDGRDSVVRLIFNLGVVPFLSAITYVILFYALTGLGYGGPASLFAVFVLGVSTPLWHYSRSAQEEHLLALTFALWLLGIARYQQGRKWGILIASIAGCSALATRWAALAPLLPLAFTTVLLVISNFRKYRGELASGVFLVVATLFILLAYNQYRFGSALETGYGLAFAPIGLKLFSLSQAPGVLGALVFSLCCPGSFDRVDAII